MESKELRFRHVGLSTDGAVVFCALDNGKTYSMPLGALSKAEGWDPKAKPKVAGIIHDGYAAFVEFNTGLQIDFPSDFVQHVCEPSYSWYRGKGRAASGVGGRIREIREARGLTLDALASKCGIAKPNLSRLENDKVMPTFETLRTVAAALDTHPALLVRKHAWTWTRHVFTEWKRAMLWDASDSRATPVAVRTAELVEVFLATRPEHRYAQEKLKSIYAPHDAAFTLDAEKWAREKDRAEAARGRAKRSKEKAPRSKRASRA